MVKVFNTENHTYLPTNVPFQNTFKWPQKCHKCSICVYKCDYNKYMYKPAIHHSQYTIENIINIKYMHILYTCLYVVIRDVHMCAKIIFV